MTGKVYQDGDDREGITNLLLTKGCCKSMMLPIPCLPTFHTFSRLTPMYRFSSCATRGRVLSLRTLEGLGESIFVRRLKTRSVVLGLDSNNRAPR